MKPLFIAIFLFFTVSVIAQKDTFRKLELTMPDTAFINKQIQRIDSINKAQDIKNMNSNMVSFMSQQMRERDEKAKQQMWMRLGFAGLMIIIAIIGFTRRKKAKEVK